MRAPGLVGAVVVATREAAPDFDADDSGFTADDDSAAGAEEFAEVLLETDPGGCAGGWNFCIAIKLAMSASTIATPPMISGQGVLDFGAGVVDFGAGAFDFGV